MLARPFARSPTPYQFHPSYSLGELIELAPADNLLLLLQLATCSKTSLGESLHFKTFVWPSGAATSGRVDGGSKMDQVRRLAAICSTRGHWSHTILLPKEKKETNMRIALAKWLHSVNRRTIKQSAG